MKGNVLLLDDNPMDLKVIAAVLEREGFAACGFTESREAMTWLMKNEIQAIFLDLQMPGISGFDLIPRLRNVDHLRDTPIVIVSGRNQIQDVKEAIRLGANDYIVKPADPLIVLEKLKSITRDRSGFYAVELDNGGIEALASKAIRIVSFSEFGMNLQAPYQIALGETFEVTNAPEQFFGGASLLVRCLSCKPRPEGRVFEIQTTFVGMGEAQRQILRKRTRSLWLELKEKAV